MQIQAPRHLYHLAIFDEKPKLMSSASSNKTDILSKKERIRG